MLLGTKFVFIFCIRRVLGGVSAPKSSLSSEICLQYLENTKIFDILVKHRTIAYLRYIDDNEKNIHEYGWYAVQHNYVEKVYID